MTASEALAGLDELFGPDPGVSASEVARWDLWDGDEPHMVWTPPPSSSNSDTGVITHPEPATT